MRRRKKPSPRPFGVRRRRSLAPADPHDPDEFEDVDELDPMVEPVIAGTADDAR